MSTIKHVVNPLLLTSTLVSKQTFVFVPFLVLIATWCKSTQLIFVRIEHFTQTKFLFLTHFPLINFFWHAVNSADRNNLRMIVELARRSVGKHCNTVRLIRHNTRKSYVFDIIVLFKLVAGDRVILCWTEHQIGSVIYLIVRKDIIMCT